MVSLLKEEDWSPELLEHELCEEMGMQLTELPPPPPLAACADDLTMAEEANDEPQVAGRSGSILHISVTSRHSQSEIMCSSRSQSAVFRRPVLLFRGPRLKIGIDVGQVSGCAKEYGRHCGN